jgi:hypothetical protein
MTMNIAIRCVVPLLFLCAGCAPAIYSFHANPRRVCGGDSVALDWKASTDGKLSVALPKGASASVPAEGTASVQPTAVVRLHLEVTNLWGSAGRDNDIEILTGRSIPVGQSVADPSATCAGSTLGVTATAPAEAWSAKALVGDVVPLAEDKHTYHIEHAGVKADLAPGGTSSAFKGTPVAGAWLLSLTLLDGEKCGAQSVPHNLGIQLAAVCGP